LKVTLTSLAQVGATTSTYVKFESEVRLLVSLWDSRGLDWKSKSGYSRRLLRAHS